MPYHTSTTGPLLNRGLRKKEQSLHASSASLMQQSASLSNWTDEHEATDEEDGGRRLIDRRPITVAHPLVHNSSWCRSGSRLLVRVSCPRRNQLCKLYWSQVHRHKSSTNRSSSSRERLCQYRTELERAAFTGRDRHHRPAASPCKSSSHRTAPPRRSPGFRIRRKDSHSHGHTSSDLHLLDTWHPGELTPLPLPLRRSQIPMGEGRLMACRSHALRTHHDPNREAMDQPLKIRCVKSSRSSRPPRDKSPLLSDAMATVNLVGTRRPVHETEQVRV